MLLVCDFILEISGNLNVKFLEVKLSWVRMLIVIIEQELIDFDNYFVNLDECNVIK